MTSRLPPIDWQTQLVDTETGRPTQFFMTLWGILLTLRLTDLEDVNALTPTDGQVLTYSAAEGKWIAS